MNHLGAAIDLLIAVRYGNRVELSARIIATQNAGWVFPGDCGAGFNLCPRNLGVVPTAIATLGNEVIDAALAAAIARIPVLNGRILDLGIIERDQFNDCCMKLVFIALWCGATFEIGDVSAFFRDDERAFELTRIFSLIRK